MLYKPRNFEIFLSWTAIWTPLFVFAGAGLMVEFWSDSFSWLSVADVLGRLVADIAKILSCLCYNLNRQKLSSNTLSAQLPNALSSFICFDLAALYKTSNSFVYILKIIGAEIQAELEVLKVIKILLCMMRGFNQLNMYCKILERWRCSGAIFQLNHSSDEFQHCYPYCYCCK